MTLLKQITDLTRRIFLEREKIKLEKEIARLVRNQQIIDQMKKLSGAA